MTPKDHARAWQDEPVHRRIRTQALAIGVIALVVLGLAVADLVDGTIGLVGAVAGLVGGVVVGVVAARVNRFSWDAETGRVVARVDRIGLAILVAVVLAHLSRNWLLGHWAHGAVLTALGVWISAGTLIGRVLGTRRGVNAVLRAAGPKAVTDPATRPASKRRSR